MAFLTLDTRIKLQVGEKDFSVGKATLEKSPWWRRNLARLQRAGPLVLDADGDIFVHILRYLRTARFPLLYDKGSGFDYQTYAEILGQAEKYELDNLASWIREETYRFVVTAKLTVTCGLAYRDEEFTFLGGTDVGYRVSDDAAGGQELALIETHATIDYKALIDRSPPPYFCICCDCKGEKQ